MELIIVMIMLGVLSTLALTHFSGTKEKFLDKEAIAALQVLQAAQKTHKVETGTYYPSAGSDSSITTINSNLGVYLPTTASPFWNYTVFNSGCCQATRNGGDGRSWHCATGDDSPTSGTCQ